MGISPSKSFAADGVDLSLIRWFLTLTPTERLAAAQDMVDTVALRNGEVEPSRGQEPW